MKVRLLSLCLLLMLLLTACVSASRQPDSGSIVGEIVYNRVYNGTIDAWSTANVTKPILWGLFWFVLVVAVIIGIGFLIDQKTIGLVGGLVLGGMVGVIAIAFISLNMARALPINAENQAIHAVKEGIDRAKFDRANVYLEELHVPVVAIYPPEQNKPEAMTCTEAIDSRSNCAPYEWTEPCCPYECNCIEHCISRDSSGNCTSSYETCSTCWRTRHVPYFTELWRYMVFVRMMSKLATPETGLTAFSEDGISYRYLSGWLVPKDYENYWRGRKRCPLNPSDYIPPADWQRYHDMVVNGQVPLVNVPHKYVNWINAAEAQVYFEYAGNIDVYEKAGLLPRMNPIYSRIGGNTWEADYDFVQNLISMSPEEYFLWQDAAASFSTYFSNNRQGSLVIVFAPKDAVEKLGTVDSWVKTIKANYQQKGKWDEEISGETLQRLMPKNLFILACVVDTATKTIPPNGCRIETGMPQGNEVIKDTFALGTDPALQNLSFSPDVFFGTMQAVYTAKEGSSFPDVTLNRDGRYPMDLLLRDDPNGLRRVSMKGFDYLQADIKLSADDITRLVTKEVQVQIDAARKTAWAAFWWLFGLCVLMGIIGAVIGYEYVTT